MTLEAQIVLRGVARTTLFPEAVAESWKRLDELDLSICDVLALSAELAVISTQKEAEGDDCQPEAFRTAALQWAATVAGMLAGLRPEEAEG